MQYDDWYARRMNPARRGRMRSSYRSARGDFFESGYRALLPRPDRRRPFPIEGAGYRGPGELRRYGDAPVPYGPEHTYDYRMGDRYGYGPDFVPGEERIRQRPLPELRSARRRRR